MNQNHHDRGSKEPLKQLNEVRGLEGNNIVEEINQTGKQEPVIKLVNRIIMKALKKEASEIHFEPQIDCLKILFRQDGILSEIVNSFAKIISLSIVKYLKNMAHIDIQTKNSYQEGRFSVIIQGNKINFWLNSLPTRYGDKAILRCWNTDRANLNLADIVYRQNTLKLVKAIMNYPSGLLLVTGPANSGKSTTICALLEEKHKSGANISTIENRIKYSLAGMNQIELIKAQNSDYHHHIKSLLNQDVEVVWIDRLRELTTAKMVIDSASHGRSLLSSLNSNDAVGAIAQLLEMGVNPSNLAQVLNGVISQRLIRRVCPSCRIAYKPSSEELNRFGLREQETPELYYANNTDYGNNAEDNDCSECNGIGYKGQIAIMEVLPITQKIRSLIAENAAVETIHKTASQQGMKDLFSYALELVMAGETTFAEVERVLPDILANLELEREVYPSKEDNFAQRLDKLEQQVANLILELQELQPAFQSYLSARLQTKQVEEEELDDSSKLNDLSGELAADSKTTGNKLRESELSKELSVDEIQVSAFPVHSQSNQENIPDPW